MRVRSVVAMIFLSMLAVSGCMKNGTSSNAESAKPGDGAGTPAATPVTVPVDDPRYRVATFAGGCFWCMQPPFDTVSGVIRTVVGYSGGTEVNPTYEEVASGSTSHTESVQITFDPALTSYEHLLDIFWRNIDPTQVDGQFADRGRQYRTAIFYHDDAQRAAATDSKQKLGSSGKFDDPIAVEITPASTFYPAEEYHQMYYKKNYDHYKSYRKGSGREGYLERTWGSE